MSNESVQTHLAIPAQSIAQTSKPTDYIVLGLPLEYIQKLDDPIEALILSRIVHWYMGSGVGRRLKGSPHKWLTKTTAELMAESGIKKEKQIRLALTALADHHHLIEVVVGGFRGKKTKFIRLLCANGQSTITDWQQVFNPGTSVNLTHVPTSTTPSVNLTHACVAGDTSNSSGDFKGNKNLNIKDAGSGNTPASITPEIPTAESGEGKTLKTEQASEPFLKICLNQKQEFIKANDNGQNIPCVLAELTPADLSTAQRLEFELTKAGVDPLAFVGWLTPQRFHHIALLDLHNAANWSLLVIMSHREMFAEKYRAYLAERAKFSSAQQIALCAMAPQAMKLSIPLYEENPKLVHAMFDHADYWQAQQTDGLLGGKTLREYLAKWQWITPAMMEWLDNEAVRERVEELLTAPA